MSSDRPTSRVDMGETFESVRIIKPPRDEEPGLTPPVAPSAETPEEAPNVVPAEVAEVVEAVESEDATAVAESTEAAGPLVDPDAETGEIPLTFLPDEPDVAATTPSEPALDHQSGPPVKERRVVVIAGDDPYHPDSVATEESPKDAIDPRIRARRRQVQRAEGRKRFRVLVSIGTVLALVIGGSILVQSPLFSVRTVRVDGVHSSDAAAIQQVADSLYGQPLYRADLAKAQDEILLQPWVRRAHLIRQWPRTIIIDIAEREPVGAVPVVDNTWRVIDVEGRVLAVTEGQPRDLMAVVGDPTVVPVGQTVSAPMIDGAHLAESLPDRLKSITTRVRVGSDGSLQLEISQGGRIVLGKINDFAPKLISVLTYLDRCPGVRFESMDVSSKDTVVVTPTPTKCLQSTLTKQPA